jgi:hypothetical protein
MREVSAASFGLNQGKQQKYNNNNNNNNNTGKG